RVGAVTIRALTSACVSPRTPAYERPPRTAPATNMPRTKNTGVCQENNFASGSVLYNSAPAMIQTIAANVPWLDFIYFQYTVRTAVREAWPLHRMYGERPPPADATRV